VVAGVMPSTLGVISFGAGIVAGGGQSVSFPASAPLTYNITGLDLTSRAFTVSLWMFTVSLAEQQEAMTLYSPDGRSFSLGVGANASLRINYQTGTADAYREVAVKAGIWNMLTITVTETAAAAATPSLTYTVYKSGVSLASLTFNHGGTRSFASLVIGGSATRPFAGRITDVRLYGVALNANQVANLYNATKS
jgi:Concanavalin A-like lectin/glucanases superfamily